MTKYGERFSQAVATELRAQRARERITFDELAAAAGMHKTTVYNYLNGKRDIPMSVFAELCRALNVEQSAIFTAAAEAIK